MPQIATFPLDQPRYREWARKMLERAPDNWLCIFRPEKRSDIQNRLLWALLSDVAASGLKWGEQEWDPVGWKDIFMSGYLAYKRKEKIAQDGPGNPVRVIGGLEGEILSIGLHTSELSKPDFAELTTYIQAWGSQRGVKWSEPKPKGEPPLREDAR